MALVSAGCGGASRPATVNATAFQACLERKGYNVSQFAPSTYNGQDPLSAISGTSGYVQGSGVVASGGSPGEGYAAVGFFDKPTDAANAEATMRQQTQIAVYFFSDTYGQFNGPVLAERSGNTAWYAWQNTARTNEDISSCLSS